jgi:uncharacterized membrane protein
MKYQRVSRGNAREALRMLKWYAVVMTGVTALLITPVLCEVLL